jgi:mRNA interferase RelE/StbE
MRYTLKYSSEVKKIDKPSRTRIKKVIEERLAVRPEVFGRPLRRTLKGYWKLRVGDYLIIYKVINQTIRIYAIIHRKEVYKQVMKRTEA